MEKQESVSPASFDGQSGLSSTATTRTSTSSRPSSPYSIARATPPKSPLMLGLGAMPREAFLWVVNELNEKDRIRATAVCRAWRTTLLGEPRLWRTFNVALHDYRHAPKTNWYIRHVPTAVRRLYLRLHRWTGFTDIQQFQSHLEKLVRCLHGHQCAVDLDELEWEINVSDRNTAVMLAYIFMEVMRCAHFDRIGSLRSSVRASDARISMGFFGAFEQPDHLVLACGHTAKPINSKADDWLGNFTTPEQGQPWSLPTQTMAISGHFFDSEIYTPHFPNLTSLTLSSCYIGANLLHLLNQMPQLRDLRLLDVRHNREDMPLDEDLDYDDDDGDMYGDDIEDMVDWKRHDRLRDQKKWGWGRYDRKRRAVPAVKLDKVTTFYCVGPTTASFWKLSDMDSTVPDIRMPNLELAVLRGMKELDSEVMLGDVDSLDAFDDEDDDMVLDALSALCFVSKKIQTLDLTDCDLIEPCIPWAFRHSFNMRQLILRGCSQLDDMAMRNLGKALMWLVELDVRGCPSISCGSLAQVVEDICDAGGRLQRLYVDDPGPMDLHHRPDDRERGGHGWEWHSASAYSWLVWTDIAVEWEEAARTRSESKEPWGGRATADAMARATEVIEEEEATAEGSLRASTAAMAMQMLHRSQWQWRSIGCSGTSGTVYE